MPDRIKKISESFSRSVDYYSSNTSMQKETAERLARALEPWQYSLPEGPVIEIGSGTGFFSEHLLNMYPGRQIIISDSSKGMIEFCRKKYKSRDKTEFKVIDAESADWTPETYSLIAANFVVQWFKNPSVTLGKMAQSLKPGGFMLISFPGSESFPQWKKYCFDLGLPFTANPLPDVEKLVISLSAGPVKVDFYEDQSTEEYKDLYSFFRHLKKSGTATSFTGKSLSLKQVRLLNDYWLKQNNGKIVVHYHTAFIAVKRDL